MEDTVDPLGDITPAILVEADGILKGQLRTGDMFQVRQWTVEVPAADNLPAEDIAHSFRGAGKKLLGFLAMLPDSESQRHRLEIHKGV